MTLFIAYDPDNEIVYQVTKTPKGGTDTTVLERMKKDLVHLTSKGYRIKFIIIRGETVSVEA